jgi:hypothetical protein
MISIPAVRKPGTSKRAKCVNSCIGVSHSLWKFGSQEGHIYRRGDTMKSLRKDWPVSQAVRFPPYGQNENLFLKRIRKY